MSEVGLATPPTANGSAKSTVWPLVRLGEVLTQSKAYIDAPEAREYPKLSVKLYGRGVVLDAPANGSSLKMQRHQIAHAGQVILSEIWGKKGAVGLVPSEGEGALCTSHFFLFDIHEDKLANGWLRAIFRANFLAGQLEARAFGTTGYAAVRPKDLLACEIPLPPLPEQRRIVAKLDEVSARAEQALTLRGLARREIELLMHAESRRVFASLDSFPSQALSQVCQGIVDCLHSNPVYSEAGIPTIRSPDVGWGVLYLDRARMTDEREYQRRVRRGEPRGGDLVVVREGGGTGRAGLAEQNQRFSLGQRVMLLRPAPEIVDPGFLLQQWLSPRIQQDHIAPLTKGSASPHLNISSIREFPIVTPPLELQRLVVRHLDAFRAAAGRAASVHVRIAAELDALVPAILDRAFKGEL